jgi:hypothetical protein
MARKPTDTVQLNLRFSETLRRRLEREAKKQDHSLNAEIVHRLEGSVQRQDEADRAAQVADAVLTHHLTDNATAGAALVGLVALGTTEGRIAAMAAITTPEGKAAALAALKTHQKGGRT